LTRPSPPLDDNGHGCVDPGTILCVPNRGLIAIEDYYKSLPGTQRRNHIAEGWIKDVNKQSLTALDDNFDTKVCDVIFAHKTPVNGEVVVVNLEGGESLRLTPWHPVPICRLTKGRRRSYLKVRADLLVEGDMLLLPKINQGAAGSGLKVSGRERKVCNACGHVHRSFRKLNPCKKCRLDTCVLQRREYCVTPKMAYIFGLVVTDGHINRQMTRVEFSSHTDELLAVFASQVSSSGIECSVVVEQGRVLVYGKEFAACCVDFGIMVGEKSYNQPFLNKVLSLPLHHQHAFVAGIIDGDGSITKGNTKTRIVSASQKFSEGMTIFLRSHGYAARCVNVGKRGFNGADDSTAATVYHVTFGGVEAPLGAWLRHATKATACDEVSAAASSRRADRIVVSPALRWTLL
jgi:hypothetical protein